MEIGRHGKLKRIVIPFPKDRQGGGTHRGKIEWYSACNRIPDKDVGGLSTVEERETLANQPTQPSAGWGRRKIAPATSIHDWVIQSWRHLSTATKILVILDVLAVLLIISFLAALSTTISQRMRAGVDSDLHRHTITLRTILSWEGYYLSAEARAMSGLEGMDDAIQTRDIERLQRVVEPIRETHGLDVVYILDGNGDILVGPRSHPFDISDEASRELIQEGFGGKSVYHLLAIDKKLWMAGVAPHFGPDGRPSAIFLLAREVDRRYLRSLSATLGPHVILIDGRLVVSSLPKEEHDQLIATGYLPDSPTIPEPYFRDVRLGNVPYRLLVTPLDIMNSSRLVVGLLQPTGLIEEAIRQTIGRVILLGFLLVSVPFILIQFLVRSVFKPLESLMRAAEIIAAGNLDQPIQIEGTAEVQALATSFDQMRIRLQRHMEEQRRWNEELDAQVRARTRELEQLFQVRDQLVAKLIFAQEEERQRIARELHDETSQALANLIVTLGMASRLTKDEEVRQRLDQVKQLAVETLEGVKRIVLDLRPRLLDDYGLLPAIRWYAEERLQQAGIDVTIDVQGNEVRLPSHIEIGIFRVIQEAVNNIARHSHATQAAIRILWQPNTLRVEIEDNGRGFDVQETMNYVKRERGLGILGMQERIALAGGTLTIDSTPGMGTRITFEIPLSSREGSYVQDPSLVGG